MGRGVIGLARPQPVNEKLVMFDTCVLVDAFVDKPHSRTALWWIEKKRFTLVLSDFIWAELRSVLPKHEAWRGQAGFFLRNLERLASPIEVTPRKLYASACSDRNDIPIIASALAVKPHPPAQIVTSDHALLDMGQYRGVRMVHPSEFIGLGPRKAERVANAISHM